ncbi:hypothetical protein BJ546DRAFT_1026466 [Cryomyces antarcticus]
MDSPIVKATVQSAVLSATSNVLAQIFTAYREHKPFSLDPTPILQFVLFSLLTCPPNFLWQQWLEDSFPGYTHASEPGTTKSIAEHPAVKDINEKAHAQKKLNVRNTAIKFALDQTVGAVVNTLLFIIGIGALRGNNGSQIMAAIRRDALPLQLAGLRLWPLVSLISFTVIPVESRTVFGSIVGVGWGVFLSLMAAGGT